MTSPITIARSDLAETLGEITANWETRPTVAAQMPTTIRPPLIVISEQSQFLQPDQITPRRCWLNFEILLITGIVGQLGLVEKTDQMAGELATGLAAFLPQIQMNYRTFSAADGQQYLAATSPIKLGPYPLEQ